MVGFLIRAAVVAIGLWVASRIVPGISFASTESLIWAATRHCWSSSWSSRAIRFAPSARSSSPRA